ncbi:MAG: ABC transporter permease [Ruminococcus sp.]|nr:ABC transporter permease [Ruminococcus sp.]
MKKQIYIKKAIFPAALWIVGMLIGLWGLFRIESLRESLPEQLAAERWDKDAVQVSCFLSEEAGLTPDKIRSVRETFEVQLSQDTENAGWYDAYSCEMGHIQAFGSKRTFRLVELILISDCYFRIHNDTLLTGSYLTEARVSSMGVVLEKQAAWDLFGSVDIIGMQVVFENRICEVTGVIESRTPSPRIYMLYGDYMCNETDSVPITSYEAILPEPVKEYGLNLFQETMESVLQPPALETENSTIEEQYHIVQNTGRLSVSGAWAYLKVLPEYITHTKPIVYPDYENEALRQLHRIAVVVLLSGAGFTLAGIAVLIAVWRMKGVKSFWITFLKKAARDESLYR